MSNSGLAGRTIVVTGAAQGIGLAYAQRLAQEKCRVILADQNDAQVHAAAAGIDSATAVPCDVTDEESCAALATTVQREFGCLDGLVNNAAVFSTLTNKPFWEITTAEWDALMAVNLRGPWMVTKALLPALQASGDASVVNIGSDAVWLGKAGYLHYVASKAGVTGMTHAMAHELGEYGIRVNTVSPGLVHTEIPRTAITEQQQTAMRDAQALKRFAQPADIAPSVLFLLDPGSGHITGQTLSVNGGLLHR